MEGQENQASLEAQAVQAAQLSALQGQMATMLAIIKKVQSVVPVESDVGKEVGNLLTSLTTPALDPSPPPVGGYGKATGSGGVQRVQPYEEL